MTLLPVDDEELVQGVLDILGHVQLAVVEGLDLCGFGWHPTQPLAEAVDMSIHGKAWHLETKESHASRCLDANALELDHLRDSLVLSHGTEVLERQNGVLDPFDFLVLLGRGFRGCTRDVWLDPVQPLAKKLLYPSEILLLHKIKNLFDVAALDLAKAGRLDGAHQIGMRSKTHLVPVDATFSKPLCDLAELLVETLDCLIGILHGGSTAEIGSQEGVEDRLYLTTSSYVEGRGRDSLGLFVFDFALMMLVEKSEHLLTSTVGWALPFREGRFIWGESFVRAFLLLIGMLDSVIRGVKENLERAHLLGSRGRRLIALLDGLRTCLAVLCGMQQVNLVQ